MTGKGRYTVLAILCAAYLLCYVARMTMASAAPFVAAEMHLSALAVGTLLSAFFVGYAVMQIPAGLLVDKLNSNRVLTASILTWSILSAATTLAGSFSALVAVRVLFGVSESAFPSAASKAIASWFPTREVGRANGIMLASTQLGACLAPAIVATLVSRWGWRAAFQGLLVPGVLVALLAWRWVKDGPGVELSPDAAVGPQGHEHERDAAASVRFVELLGRPAVIWCFAATFCSNLASWGLMNWLPTYLLNARGFSILQMGLFASLPSLAGALGYFIGGQVSDRYFAQRRRVPIVFGLILGALFVYVAATAPTGQVAIACLVVAFFFLFIADAGLCTLPLVIAPQAAVGRAFGLVNTAAQLAAFLSPLMVGFLLNATGNNFLLVFNCFVAALVVAAVAAGQIQQETTSSQSALAS